MLKYDQPGTFKCACKRCNTCHFIRNADKITGSKRSIEITERFTCTSVNFICCITCTLCEKTYIGGTGRRLGDHFHEQLRDVERNDKDASKQVAQHFNLPDHSSQLMTIYGLFTTLKIKARSVNLKIACVIHMDMHVHELLNPRGL